MPPSITSASVTVLLSDHVTNVTLIGTDLDLVTGLDVFTLGPLVETPCTNLTLIDSTVLKADFPAHARGDVSLKVSFSGGPQTSFVSFTYSEVVPRSGDELTGQRVEVAVGTGTTRITFNDVDAQDLIVSATKTTAVVPPLIAGAATIKRYVGATPTTLTDTYTYNAVALKHRDSMKSLMTKTKELLAEFVVKNGRLWGIQQVKRGIRPSGILPVVCILPVGQAPAGEYSNSRIDIANSLRVSVWTKGADKQDAQDKVMELADKISDTLKFYHPLQAGGQNLTVGTAVLGQVAESDTGLVRRADIPLTIVTRRYRPTPTTSLTWSEDTPVDVLTQVYNTILSYADTDLSGVNSKMFVRGAASNIGIFPALVTILEDDSLDRTERGLDCQERMFVFEVYDKLSAKEDAMDHVLDITEALLGVIWKNVHWGGMASCSDLVSVSYGMAEAERGLQCMAETRMNLTCKEAVERTQV